MPHHRPRAFIHTLLAALLVTAVCPTASVAAPAEAVTPDATEQVVTVGVTRPTPSIAPDGRLQLDVAVTTAAPADYLEVRVRLRSPAGKLIYQKTEVRTGLPAGAHTISFERDFADAALDQGRYPIEIRVLATGADATTISGRLLVIDPDTRPLPVSVVVLPTDVPSVTMAGTLGGDPAVDTRLRDDLAFFTQLARDRGQPLSIALAPVLTEQLARVAGGYETTAGVQVAVTDETPMRYARMLDALRSAVATGTIDLLDVPYGLPDNAALTAIGGASDIAYHWTYTDTVNALVFPSAERPTVAYVGRDLTAEAVASAADRGADCVLVHAGSLRSDDTTASPGCYSLDGSSPTLLVIDEEASAGVLGGQEAFYDTLFDRLGTDRPVVVLLRVGAGSPDTSLDVQHALDWIDEAWWLNAADLTAAARCGTRERATLVRPDRTDVDTGYWERVSESRSVALALAAAAGLQDADVAASARAVLTAESSLLTDPDAGDRALAEGLARATEAYEYAMGQFKLVRLDVKDVTLSGSKGDVPLTLINDTGKQLRLTLRATSTTMRSTAGSQEVAAGPTQNFLTLPVDLGNALSDRLEIIVSAGDVTVAKATVDVKASYVDRLATVAMVVIVLAALLVFIRRRVQSTDAATIVQDAGQPPGANGKK